MLISNQLVRAVTNPEQTFMSIQVSVRHGKALGVDTPIPTPTGWRRMGDLRQGDRVFAGDGSVCRVSAVSPVWGNRPCSEVRFSDGDSVVADDEHEWAVHVNGARRTITTAEMSDWLAKPRRAALAIPLAEAQYPTADLPVDPWVLGYWLGNGSHSSGEISSHHDDIDRVRSQFEAAGFPTTDRSYLPHHHFGALDLWPKLKMLGYGGGGNRFIPEQYLVADVAQRRRLLQGLIDSDGYVAPDGQVEFCSIIKELAEQVRELVWSLGVKASLVEGDATLDGRFISRKYRVMFYSAEAASGRKRKRCRDASSPRSRRYVAAVDRVAPRDTVCIQVTSADHTFLCGRSHTPTHNSELVSKYFIVWFLGLFPDANVLIVSYNEDFAKKWGRSTRDLYAEWGPELFGHTVREDASSTTEWLTTGGGGLRAVGAGGSITGLGFDLIVIDDPIKNSEEAASPAANEKMREWYDTTLRTRLMPGGTMVLTMARWSDYDLAAYVTGEMEREVAQQFPDAWQTLKLPAIAEAPMDADDDWRDELGRVEGEALWPEVWPVEALRPMMGTSGWDALYQQNPIPKTGGMFPKENWQIRTYPHDAAGWRKVRFWDTAASKGKGDWTVGALLGIDHENNVWVLDVVRERADASGVERLLVDTAHRDGRAVAVRYEEAKAAAGKATTQAYSRLLLGFDFKGIPVEGDKASRAALYAAAQQNRLVILAEGPWNGVFIDEHTRFQRTKHDDQVDAASGAFKELTAGGPVSITSPSQVIVADPMEFIRREMRAREEYQM